MKELRFNPFPLLETKRLSLRKIVDSDAQALFEYQSDKSNFEFVDMPIYEKIDEAYESIAKKNKGVEENKWIIWAIADKLTDEIMGTISIWNFNIEENKAEVGYGIFASFRRMGYMSEALKCVCDYGFKTLGLTSIEAYTNIINNPSRKMLESIGFCEKEVIEEETSEGNLMKMAVYSLDREL